MTIFRVQAPSKAAAVAIGKNARLSGLWMSLHKKGSLPPAVSGELVTKHARDLPPEFAGASPDTIIGPQHSTEGNWVGQLLQRRAAVLNDSTRARIEALIFEDWLAERRKLASIRWQPPHLTLYRGAFGYRPNHLDTVLTIWLPSSLPCLWHF